MAALPIAREMAPTIRACSSCHHWDQLADAARGRCTADTPRADATTARGWWPVTLAHEFCGAWRAA